MNDQRYSDLIIQENIPFIVQDIWDMVFVNDTVRLHKLRLYVSQFCNLYSGLKKVLVNRNEWFDNIKKHADVKEYVVVVEEYIKQFQKTCYG